MYYFGFYKDLFDLNISNSESYDLYEKDMARYYDKLAEIEKSLYDIDIYIKNAAVLGGEVLELACGSGRIMLPMAERGFQVTGIDISPDMLELLEEKLSNAPQRIRKRITTYQCDMSDFNLSKKFSLVILAATSISLLLKNEQIRTLFKCVNNHLEKGGRFIFDYRTSDSIIQNAASGKTHCHTWNHGDNKKEFVLLSESVDYSKLHFHVNFYAELIENCETKRFFGSSVKRIIDEDDIIDIVRNENFNLIDTSLLEVAPGESIKFVILEKR
ncbi:hypothetical protein FACS1894127_1830 [Clostridia bacterium]|nr:hypothetical protein FACS1894127_1830 [Clostridia bacterium]